MQASGFFSKCYFGFRVARRFWRHREIPLLLAKAALLALCLFIALVCGRLYNTLESYEIPSTQLKILEDPYAHLTLQDVEKSGDFSGSSARINKGYSESIYWIKIDPGYLEPGGYLLSLNYFALNSVDLYYWDIDGNRIHLRSGLNVERARWPVNRADIMFPLTKLAVDKPIYLAMASEYSVQATLELMPVENSYFPVKKVLWGVFYGCLLVMFLYNANIFFGTNDPAYFFYSVHTFFAIAADAALSGHGHLIWPQTFDTYSITVMVSLFWLASVLLCTNILNLKQRTPRFYRIFAALWLLWASILTYSLLTQSNLSTLTTPLSIASCAIIIVAGFYCIRDTYAKYFVIAWSVYLIGIVSICLGFLGLVPRNTFTVHAGEYGQLFEIVFLAFSLAARMKQLRHEKLQLAKNNEETFRQLLSMTQQKYDATTEAAQAKDRFLATLSHEMKTPMHGIITPLRHLLENHHDDETVEHLELSIDSANRMKVMLDQLLRLSDLEAGRLQVVQSPTNLISSCSTLASLIKNYCESKGLSFTFIVGKNVPECVITDGKHLIEALRVFLENAVKYTDTGGVLFGIFGSANRPRNANEEDGSESHINVFISDTGMGIDEKTAPHLFSKFTQADDGSNRRFGGLGIDLAFAQNILHQLNGSVKFTSAINRGTLFHIRIPIQPTTQGEVVELSDYRYEISKSINQTMTRQSVDASVDQRTEPEPGNKKKILLVEDDPTNQLIAKKILEKFDIHVSIAANGNECLKSLDEEEYDLVLMDCQMPVKDGYQATQEIRSSNRAYKNIPIVAVTANSMSGDREKCLDTGMDDYLAKPYTPASLRECVERWCRKTDAEVDSAALSSRKAPHTNKAIPAADRKKILLIEDDEANQYITTKIVQGMGHSVCVTGNGTEGLKRLRAEHFDLILMDCRLSDMDGYRTTDRIRELDNEKAKLPIIALTVAPLPEDQERCQQAGMDDCLAKPYSVTELESKIDYWLSTSSVAPNANAQQHELEAANKQQAIR